jgi:hypothetical protein
VNWSSRVPPRPPRRTTNPYPPRFAAVCGACGGGVIARAYDLARVDRAAEVHGELQGGHAAFVEVVPIEDVTSE